MKRALMIGWMLTISPLLRAEAADVDKGIKEFEQRQWMASIREFIDVLKTDPQNRQAHDYLSLAIQQMQIERGARLREWSLAILDKAANRLESNHLDATNLRQDVAETRQAEANVRADRWHAQCQMAVAEDRLGHLEAANDLVFRVLADDSANAEAQRILSDLQSQIHETLELSSTLSATERAALEGFYAYGQADYRTAALAWSKARTALETTVPANELNTQLDGLHFENYQKVAQAHVDEEDRAAHIQQLFAQGTELFQKRSYAEALDRFRQVALLDPDYPQLGRYLAQSEADVETERTRRLSQEKRERAGEAFARGLAALEKNQYAEARQAFKAVLTDDPTHPQAKSYLSVVETEMSRRHDPHAAEQHYEAGVISFAGGKVEEALREWAIATRLDPGNVRAANALTKARKVLDENRDVPG